MLLGMTATLSFSERSHSLPSAYSGLVAISRSARFTSRRFWPLNSFPSSFCFTMSRCQ